MGWSPYLVMLRRILPPLRLMYQAWTGKYQLRGADQEADCVIGFSYGYRSKSRAISPGLSNDDLAYIAATRYQKLPKILQFEIANAYAKRKPRDAKNVIRIEDSHTAKEGEGVFAHASLDTREVVMRARNVMREHDWQTALLLAHPYHMPRVQAVCGHFGVDWVADGDEQGAIEFDPRSAQRWTRNRADWRLYEPLALYYYHLKGWL